MLEIVAQPFIRFSTVGQYKDFQLLKNIDGRIVERVDQMLGTPG